MKKNKNIVENKLLIKVKNGALILLVAIVFFGVSIYSDNQQDKSRKNILGNTKVLLRTKEITIKNGLQFATDRAKKWNDNAELVGTLITFNGKENIVKKYGVIEYVFSIHNDATSKTPYTSCSIDLDIKKKEITNVWIQDYVNDRLWFNPEESLNSFDFNIDIKQFFNLLESDYKSKYSDILKGINPNISIRIVNKSWYVYLLNNKESIFINLNSINGKVNEVYDHFY